MNERLYLFNPFETKKATNNELRDIYNIGVLNKKEETFNYIKKRK